MNYYRDLLPQPDVSGPKATFGVILFLIFLVRFIMVVSSATEFDLFEWLAYGVWLIIPAQYILEGLGYRLFRVPGNAYVRIDGQGMALKPSVLSKENAVHWNDVNDILYSAEKYTMRTRDGGKVVFELTTLPYAVIQEIKAAIDELAAEKRINIIRRMAIENTAYTNRHRELS